MDFGGIAYKHQFDRLLHLASKLQIVMDGENKVRQVRKAIPLELLLNNIQLRHRNEGGQSDATPDYKVKHLVSKIL